MTVATELEREEVLLRMLRELVLKVQPEVCQQCHKCVAACAAARAYESYRPSKIVRLAGLGLLTQLISGEDIWRCTQCLACVDLCPQEVKPAQLVVALRNVAVSVSKRLPSTSWQRLIRSVTRLGAMSEETHVFTRDGRAVRRRDIGLHELRLAPKEEILALLEGLGEEVW